MTEHLGHGTELIVVDNASGDGVAARVASVARPAAVHRARLQPRVWRRREPWHRGRRGRGDRSSQPRHGAGRPQPARARALRARAARARRTARAGAGRFAPAVGQWPAGRRVALDRSGRPGRAATRPGFSPEQSRGGSSGRPGSPGWRAPASPRRATSCFRSARLIPRFTSTGRTWTSGCAPRGPGCPRCSAPRWRGWSTTARAPPPSGCRRAVGPDRPSTGVRWYAARSERAGSGPRRPRILLNLGLRAAAKRASGPRRLRATARPCERRSERRARAAARSGSRQLRHQALERRQRSLRREALEHVAPTGRCEVAGTLGVDQQGSRSRRASAAWSLGRDEQRRLAVAQHLRDRADARRHDRARGDEGLAGDTPERLGVARRVDDNVGRRIGIGDAGLEAAEADGPARPQRVPGAASRRRRRSYSRSTPRGNGTPTSAQRTSGTRASELARAPRAGRPARARR